MIKFILIVLQIFKYGQAVDFRACDDCQQYSSCKGAHIFAETQKIAVTSELFGNSSCGIVHYDGREIPMVCCSDFSDSKLKLLPDECGAISENISSGRVTGLYEFPWMALISYKRRIGYMFSCAGTIINDLYVLTAAHCDDPNIAGVRVGDHDIRNDCDCQGEHPNMFCESHIQNILIEEIIKHESYRVSSSSVQKYDIALLRLKDRIEFNHMNVAPICLPIPLKVSNESISGKQGIVAGWGTTETNQMSTVMLKVELPILFASDCLEKYSDILSNGAQEMEHIICAGELYKDSCSGDSGGPLFVESKYNGDFKYVQFGIVSTGPRTCGSDMPGIYTDVRDYVDWILDNIRS